MILPEFNAPQLFSKKKKKKVYWRLGALPGYSKSKNTENKIVTAHCAEEHTATPQESLLILIKKGLDFLIILLYTILRKQ